MASIALDATQDNSSSTGPLLIHSPKCVQDRDNDRVKVIQVKKIFHAYSFVLESISALFLSTYLSNKIQLKVSYECRVLLN